MSVAKDQLTDALNATFITYNGNELTLQNDMGNSKIQDKKTGSIMGLKEGYIPVAMQEHGGILYIASYNPKEKRSELGSIPSPLFDYTISEPDHDISCETFLFGENYNITNTPIMLSLDNDTLFYPGDAIKCGLCISGDMPNLLRNAYILSDQLSQVRSEQQTIEYPYISTREKSGLITLHLLAIPSNSSESVDLQQHEFGPNKLSAQWFFDSSNGTNANSDTIVYPNIQSGQLAVLPVRQTISDVKLLLNSSTGQNEPYYIQQDAFIITVKYTKVQRPQSSKFPYTHISGSCTLTIDGVEQGVDSSKEFVFSCITDKKVTIKIPNLDPGTGTGPDPRTVLINDTLVEANKEGFFTKEVGQSTTIDINDTVSFKALTIIQTPIYPIS